MKKIITVALVIGLVAGAMLAPAEAKKKKKKPRTVSAPYSAPAAGIVGVGYLCGAGCLPFPTLADEAFVSIKVEDDAGTPVGVALAQDTNADGIGDIFATVCGETSEPIAITPGLELTVAIGEAVAVSFDNPAASCPSVSTTGTVTATFGATEALATPKS